MSKKLIIITAGLGLAGFAGMFAFAWFTKPSAVAQNLEGDQSISSVQESGFNLMQPQVAEAMGTSGINSAMKKAMTEKQLKSLVYEVREKIGDYDNMLVDLKTQEQRQQLAHESIKEDIAKLNNLQVELASTIAQLKNEQQKLLKSRIEITKVEKTNMMSTAAFFDKMDSASAGKILTDMSRDQNDGAADVVKILYYMTERTKAKVLASIAETEPTISAYFCQRLKEIIENG